MLEVSVTSPVGRAVTDLIPERAVRAVTDILVSRRSLDPLAPPCRVDAATCCAEALVPVVAPAVSAGQPLHMVLPAFPAKSPSPRKVLGPHPDMAEEQGLRYLQRLCDQIAAVHPPGARITICSDGRVFSDVVGVTDDDVTAYATRLREMIESRGMPSLEVIGLEDVDLAGTGTFDELRTRLCHRHAEPLTHVRAAVRTRPAVTRLFNGIHRFLVEDRAHLHPDRSRNWLRADCKARAYLMLQRSAAWSALIQSRFPTAVRLSIHPQAPHAGKLGIRLSDHRADRWITPWHGVALRRSGDYYLVHRHQAETTGARLVHRDGLPSHFELR